MVALATDGLHRFLIDRTARFVLYQFDTELWALEGERCVTL